MRERHVYPTDRIAHLWAHQTQDEARNPQGNFYFKGATIYSYRDSFPIGKIVTNGTEKAYLVTTNRYSNTTSGHIASVARSIPHGSIVFHVEGMQNSWRFDTPVWQETQLNEYNEQITKVLLTASRARQNKDWHISKAQGLHDEATRFAKFYNLDASGITPLNLDLSVIKAAQRSARKAELAEEKARQAQALIDQAGRIADWRNGHGTYYGFYDIPTMLRIKGDEVETSRGAVFPVKDAIRGLKLVRKVMRDGASWVRDGFTVGHRLGHYQINRIEADGTVHAGCHVVSWAEIERIAPQLEALQETKGDEDTGSSSNSNRDYTSTT